MGKWVIIFFVILGTLISVFTTTHRLANLNKDRLEQTGDTQQKKYSGLTMSLAPPDKNYSGLKLTINLPRQSYRSIDEITFQTSLTNIADTPQNIILYTGSFYAPYCMKLVNKESNKSALEFSTKACLSSHLITSDEWEKILRPYHRWLKVGQSVIKQYKLIHIAPLKNRILPPGTYTVSLSFMNIQSNELTFTIDSLASSLN